MLSDLMKHHKPVNTRKIRNDDFLESQTALEKSKIAAIEKGSGWKTIGVCPVCQSTRREVALEKHSVELLTCLECGARYGAKIAKNLDDVYKSQDYKVYGTRDAEADFNYRKERFGRERVALLEEYSGSLKNKKILDVGCGNGFFLAVAREKTKTCYGTESSPINRAHIKEKLGVEVYEENLEKLPANEFDIVTLFDVIEHIPEPVSFMRAIDRIVKPGGHIFIFTPNFDSFSIRVMKDRSSIVDPSEHVVLYTLPTLRKLGKILSYDVVYEATQGLDIFSILSLPDFATETASAFLSKWAEELQAMINRADCGDYARILYQKKA